MSEAIYDSTEGCPSNGIWIALFIIFLLVAVGLGIWLAVLYFTGKVGDNEGNKSPITLGNPRITATLDSITGAWGTLTEKTDKVTLYVSEKPFQYDINGNVIVNQTTVQSAFNTGSDNSVQINVGNSESRNAMLIVTREGSEDNLVYGPMKVYTQVEANLSNRLFTITDLNTCNGGVSTVAGFSTQSPSQINNTMVSGTNDYGVWRLGSNVNSNTMSSNFLVRYNQRDDPNDITTPPQLICRIPNTSSIGLGYWQNETASTETPIVCRDNPSMFGETGCPMDMTIPLDHCQWSYNLNPNGAQGQNKWCLSTAQSLMNNGARNPVCMSHDGSSLILTNISSADQWINLLTGTVSESQS